MTVASTPSPADAAPSASVETAARTAKRTHPFIVWIVPLILLLLWWVCTDVLGIFAPNQLPSPLQVLRTAGEQFTSGDLTRNIWASLQRVLLGFAIGSLIAVIVATLAGLSQTVERLLDPTLQALRNVPSLAWVPFLLLWLGIDEAPKITLIAIGGFFPVYLNLLSGIRQVDRKLLEVGYVFGLGDAALVRRIILPSAVPYLMTGLRVGFGQSWLFLVAAELIASTRGLGFMLIDGQNSSRPDIMLVSIIALALLGKLCDGLLRTIEKRLLVWTDGFSGR